MKKDGLHLIATGDANWDYYLAPPFEDGSQAVLYIAKENSGAGSGIYCGVSHLRSHLHLLAMRKMRRNNDGTQSFWDSIIPDDWHIVDADFFRSLGIE